jgi:predicted extracellular nuclease
VVVNHFKSKGSSCANAGDPDLGDGQGNCNQTRRRAARALAEWLASDPTSSGGAPSLILGDLNAHPLEDPLGELASAGFVDLLSQWDSPDAYTFVFDGRAGRLDHALASPQLALQTGGAAVWNINADESPALGYGEDNPAGLYSPDPRRASDHDPIIVGLFPRPVPEPDASWLFSAALAVLYTARRYAAGSQRRPTDGKPHAKRSSERLRNFRRRGRPG